MKRLVTLVLFFSASTLLVTGGPGQTHIGRISTALLSGAASPRPLAEDTQQTLSPSRIILTPGQPVAALDKDWESEIIRMYNRFEEEYGARRNDKMVEDTYPEDFVWLSLNTLIKGDIDYLKMELRKRETLGRWDMGPPHIVSTCGNTALVWNSIVYTDDNNLELKGLETIFYEYLDGMAKVKVIQSPSA